MIEVKLDEPVVDSKAEEKRHVFAIMNERGQFLKSGGNYWTYDLNKCIPEIRNYNTQLNNARHLMENKQRYLAGEKCLNVDLYYGFEKIYLQEVELVKVN